MADTEKTVVSFTAHGISGTSYFTGEESNVQVYRITVTYSDESTEQITTGFTVTQVDTSKAGIQYSTVAYSGIEIEIEIHIFDSYTGEVGSPVKTDVTVYLDLDTGILSVNGTGALSSTIVDSDGNCPPSSLYTRTKKIVFSEGITEISDRFANDFSNIEDVVFPDSLTKIGDQNFSPILASKIEIPESVTEIGNMVFNTCSNLTKLIFHEGLESIGSASFMSCPLLKSVVLPESLKIMRFSFSNCTLENMTVGGEGAVLDGGNLNIPTCENVIIRGGTIATGLKYVNIKKMTLGSKVEFSGDSNFYGNNNLTSVVIGDGITQVPSYCFTECTSLSAIEISPSVKTIGTNAFAGANSPTIKINQEEDAISGAPWGATNATIEWLGTEKNIVKIEVTSLPDKVEYKKGEVFNSSGLTVKAVYNDDTEEEITDYTLSTPDMSTAGTKTITVTSQGQTATFDILVIAIYKIEITTLPTKLEYRKGDTLDTTGLVVSTVWTDGSKETITDYTLSGFDSTETGEKTITITYQTFTATFNVTVVADTAGIRISHYPNKVYYKIGETLDTTGLAVAKYRADGTEVEITGYTVSDLDSSTSGSKTVNVFYTEAISSTESETFNTDFQVRVTKDGKNPFDDSSSGGSGDVEEEKTEPIKVTVHWINGEFADLTNENIDQNTLTLQESICSEQYFIFGGCVCNQITFQAHHDQFNGTSEEFYPSGKIEVYIERKGTKIKIFTGEIDSAERKANSLTRNFIAYDYLYKLRNTDIARWYKNQTTDKKKKLTQKQFRDKLFEFLGLEQVSTKLHWDDTYVPDTNNSNEMNVVNILKDLCLQNDRFGWMNRDGKFEYLKLRQNSYRYGQTTDNQNIYKYYNNEEVHLDTFKSFTAKEGRIWFPNIIFCDPDPNRAFGFTQGDYTAQEAYDNNVYYNRNSFFVGNEDWLNYVWNADEYGGISRVEPIMKICYGVFVDQDLRKYYRAQGYTAEVQGNPLNMVGQAVELYYKKQIQHDDQEPTELQWYVHSYIMSRTLKIGITDLIDTYSANNAPFNSNSQQLGKYTPEVSATVNKTRSELPTISYEEFTDGSDFSTQSAEDVIKKAQLRCLKKIDRDKYDNLVTTGSDRADTIYFTVKKSGSTTTYAAFANRQEIEDFPINGVNTDEIYGGDTLLWKKDDSLAMKEICSVRATYYWTSDTSLGYTRYYEVELSVRNQTEDGKEYISDNTKAGIYTKLDSGSSGSWSTYTCDAYIMFDGNIAPNNVMRFIKNVKKTVKKYDMSGTLLEETESWEYSTKYADGVYKVGYGDGGYSLVTNPFPIEVYTSGSGEFNSYDELKEYFGVS